MELYGGENEFQGPTHFQFVLLNVIGFRHMRNARNEVDLEAN